MNHWVDCENIYVKHYGDCSEPDLIYKGLTFSYHKVLKKMWQYYSFSLGFSKQSLPKDPYKFPRFREFLKEHAEKYLDSLLDV